MWAPWVYCSHETTSVRMWFIILLPVMLLWMIVLFRLLGTTAEEFFSPSLEMFSTKLGLPPRFAGVTLLALGNGAADVSATMSAMQGDVVSGYKFSLGALSGAAMFISCIICGMVIIAAGGVPSRGALIRDVTTLMITVTVVALELRTGHITPGTVSRFLSLYGVFVGLVLIADVYHRSVVLPRMAQANAAAKGDQESPDLSSPVQVERTESTMSRIVTAFSNYDNPCGGTADVNDDPPINLHGQNGLLHHGRRHHHATEVATSNPFNPPKVPVNDAPSGAEAAGSDYALAQDASPTSSMFVDRVCVDDGSPAYGSGSWHEGWNDSKMELRQHFVQLFEDTCWNSDLSWPEKFLVICESPFTVLRKITIPIPCEGHYNRGVLALAMVLSPIWFTYFIWNGHGIKLYTSENIGMLLIVECIAIFIAAMIIRYAPGGEGPMALGLATPLGLYGFMIAATWINFVAIRLVSLLDFMGIILHIPGSLMGMTVLAWGNSMGDLSANVTMARKGLANMAMTACFAGPIFNILVGLGMGFYTLMAELDSTEVAVVMPKSVGVGFLFIILNGVAILVSGLILGKGRIGTFYGYVAMGFYSVYLILSVTLHFVRRQNDSGSDD